MAPHAPKRRRLDHGYGEIPSVDNDHLENGEENSASDLDEKDNAPVAAHPHPGLRRTQNGDDDTIYTATLYKSSMFKLQVDEMLAEVRPNYKTQMHVLDDALRRLKVLIEGIEDREAVAISEATKSLFKSQKIIIPFPEPKPDRDAAYKLAYAKPSNINVVGSYAHKTMVKSDSRLSVDMVVIMPSSIFQEKDYLNYRYFYKRSHYLACIAAGLEDSAHDEFALQFDYLNENSLHPILVVKPKQGNIRRGDSNLNYEIHIIPGAPPSFFAESKLLPTKNSIRPKDASEVVIAPLPSPFYNSSLQSDCNFEPYLKLLHSTSKQSNGFNDSCVLGRIWLRQRGFDSRISKGGFGYFEWAVLAALLLKGGGPKGHSVLSSGYSSYQMFKAVVQFLSANDLANKPMVYEALNLIISSSDFPMVYDGPRGQNLLYKMTPWSYSLLRDEAKTSLEMLNDSTFDQFESTFILLTAQPLQRYDCVVRVSASTFPKEPFSCDHISSAVAFSKRVFDVLREGLKDRIRLIDIKIPETSSWPIKSCGPSIGETQPLLLAVVFDPANIDRLVDHGPAAGEKKKAAKFQKFWGEKAELRRFKDGSILESLVWSPGSSYSIFQEITTYLIKRHFDGETSESLKFLGESFEKVLPGAGTGAKSFAALKQAFHDFEKNFRDLDSLPLQLRQFSAVSAQLRYASIDPPYFGQKQPLQKLAEVLIQFEGSGRWPDDIVAIQRTKIAFLLKIGILLQESNADIITRLGLENEYRVLQNCAFLDIVYPSGAAFRLRIHNDREQILLERQIKDKSIHNQAREDAVTALSTYKRLFIQLPLHTQSIATHCTRFPLLSPTIRLLKIWFNRHMLSGHISEELIELLVARIFFQPYPWRAPSSVMSGFLRTLLFISRWDWRLEPLIVDFTGMMTSKEVASINTRLEAWRKIDPGMQRTVVFAASSNDMSGLAFTDTGPSKMVAARMTALARSACKMTRDQGFDLDQRSLFASSTKDYDFVIHLASKFTGDHMRKETHQGRFKNLQVQSEVDVEAVGHHPVQLFLGDLQKLYGSSVVFFHCEVASSIIGGLWNPQTITPRPLKVKTAYASKQADGTDVNDEGKVQLDKPAILAEIARLGGDMVSRIEVKR